MNGRLMAIGCALLLSLTAACSSEPGDRAKSTGNANTPATTGPSPEASPGPTAPKVGVHPRHRPHTSVITRVKAIKPPASAKKTNTIGRGKLAVRTNNASGDTDSFWVEELDLDSDGKMEQTDLLYDDEDKVLYLFAEKEFSCADGTGEARGGMLMAVYGQGNKLARPAGSGWYLVELDASECNARAAALWGCKFDANGNRTECGIAEARAVEDDIVIVEPDPSAVPATPSATPSPSAAPGAGASPSLSPAASPSAKAGQRR